jgi:hypothetical protein
VAERVYLGACRHHQDDAREHAVGSPVASVSSEFLVREQLGVFDDAGEGESGELIAKELLVDRTGEGDKIDCYASDLLRLRFLEVTGELN